MPSMISITIPFFALIGCGYLAGRYRVLPDGGVAGINVFVFYFALPALLFRTMATRPLVEILDPAFIGIYAVTSLIVFAAGALVARVLFSSGLGATALTALSGCYSNIGYMGLPLVVALLGDDAALPIALALSVDLVLMTSITIAALEAEQGWGGEIIRSARRVAKAVIFNPLVLSLGAGMAVSAAGTGLAAPLDTFTGFLSAAAGPAALFAIGATLVGRPLSSGFGEISQMTIFKLFVHPAALWIAMTVLFPVDPLWARAATLVAAMPMAGTIFVLAQRYNVNAGRCSTAILVSTVLGVVTISMLVSLMGF